MRNISKERFSATNVLIEFEDGPVSFRVRHAATFAEISEIVDRIGTWRGRDPFSIDVHFETPKDNRRGRTFARPVISYLLSQLAVMDYAASQTEFDPCAPSLLTVETDHAGNKGS